ncbi:hypothetical protein D3C72_861930 [compost metagenome]
MKRLQCAGQRNNLVTRQRTSAFESAREFTKTHDNQVIADPGLERVQFSARGRRPERDRKLQEALKGFCALRVSAKISAVGFKLGSTLLDQQLKVFACSRGGHHVRKITQTERSGH